jgi:hypothetical protein
VGLWVWGFSAWVFGGFVTVGLGVGCGLRCGVWVWVAGLGVVSGCGFPTWVVV